MAWYAELKRRKWYCINGCDMVTWYSNYLYDLWWNSLTDEQKARIEDLRKQKKEQHEREVLDSLRRLGMITSAVLGGSMEYRDKYNGIYDEYGFPRV